MLQFHAGIVVGGSYILALMMISFAYMISYFCDLQQAIYTFANVDAAVLFIQNSDKIKSCSESVEVAIGRHWVVGNVFFLTDPVAGCACLSVRLYFWGGWLALLRHLLHLGLEVLPIQHRLKRLECGSGFIELSGFSASESLTATPAAASKTRTGRSTQVRHHSPAIADHRKSCVLLQPDIQMCLTVTCSCPSHAPHTTWSSAKIT